MVKKEHLPILLVLGFSLAFHLVGCFFLYDFDNNEGGYLINAKNIALFNTISLEGVYNTALSPLHTLLHTFLYQLFSPGIFISRYISILFAFFLLAIFYVFAKKGYGRKIAVFSVLVIAVNGIFNRFTTLAIMEAEIYFFAILATLFCFSSRPWVRRLSFLPFSVCLGFKPILFYLAIPFLYAISTGSSEENSAPKLNKKIITEIGISTLGTLLLTGLIFYGAYAFNPEGFLTTLSKQMNWLNLAEDHTSRFEIYRIIQNPLHYGPLPALYNFFQRSPITSLFFLWGVIAAVLEKKKTTIDKFLLLWVFTEIIFYSLQSQVDYRYFIDLMFPLSILSVKALLGSVDNGKLSGIKKYHAPQLLLVLIATFQIGASLFFFLAWKPERPAMETSRWLAENISEYELALAPFQTIIDVPDEILSMSDVLTVNDVLLSRKVTYPVLCIVQRSSAHIFKEDEALLEAKGQLINTIGHFWIYEIWE
ncbi:MAG: hypothetical protein VX395_01415 [Pseudomonadota bacterium]|nr:hypothetical protein [Pseudomonadota bacterium]